MGLNPATVNQMKTLEQHQVMESRAASYIGKNWNWEIKWGNLIIFYFCSDLRDNGIITDVRDQGQYVLTRFSINLFWNNSQFFVL